MLNRNPTCMLYVITHTVILTSQSKPFSPLSASNFVYILEIFCNGNIKFKLFKKHWIVLHENIVRQKNEYIKIGHNFLVSNFAQTLTSRKCPAMKYRFCEVTVPVSS